MPVRRERLRQARRAAGLTQEQLARALRVHVTTVRRWEQATSTPSAYVMPALARQLRLTTTGLQELLAEGAPAMSAPTPPSVVRWSDPVASPVSVGAWWGGAGTEEDMRRRSVLGAAAGGILVGGVLIGMDPVRGLDEALGAPVTDHDVLEWERTADQYARLISQPAHELLPPLLADLADAGRQFHAAPEGLRPGLARSCALLSGVAALSLLHAGGWVDADRWWRSAERAARFSGDRLVASLLAGRRAVYAMYAPASSPGRVLGLVETALGWADGRACAGAVSALGARAQILAMVGDRSGAHRALDDLDALYGRLDEATTGNPGSAWSGFEARLWHTHSFVYSHLGDLHRAASAQDAALASFSSSDKSHRGAAKVRLHQAMSTIASGDPASGARHVVTVLESLDPSHRGGDVRTTAVMAVSRVPDRAAGHPEVRQAREVLALTAKT